MKYTNYMKYIIFVYVFIWLTILIHYIGISLIYQYNSKHGAISGISPKHCSHNRHIYKDDEVAIIDYFGPDTGHTNRLYY